MAQFCPQCNAECEDWRPFCRTCGVPLTAEAAASRAEAPPMNGPGALPSPPAPADIAHAPGTGPIGPSGWTPPPIPAIPYPTNAPHTTGGGAKAAIAIAVTLVLVAAGAMAYLALRPESSPYPKKWDTRVEPYAQKTAKLRGLPFLHPVKVKFYTEAEFVKLVDGSDRKERSNDDKKKAEFFEGAMRAIGVAEGDVDLEQSTNDLNAAGILAFYDPDTKSMSIRGTELTVATSVTLVHELTHALQDQHFDLNRIQKQSEAAKSSASRGLIEGDASWVENAYIETLEDFERKEYDKELDDDRDTYTKGSKDVPDFLKLSKSAPYAFGESFVGILRSTGGQSEVDRAFRNPPMSEHLIADAVRFIDDATAKKLADASLPTGATDIERNGEFGTVSLLLMLSERIDPHLALTAINGWAADANTLFRDASGSPCVALQYTAVNAAGTTTMRSALQEWKAKMPATARVTLTDDDKNAGSLKLVTCDPGTEPDLVTGKARTGFNLLSIRNDIVAKVAEDEDTGSRRAPIHLVRCLANNIVGAYSVKQLTSGALFNTPDYQQRITGWRNECLQSTKGLDSN